ncbi:putative N6-adenine methyltransferase-domain-containing protein [Chaetomium sp. MPI-CAGE-AT-0009]|nr:putative N6-adenine methyltransferase-domain-containing protein [Chaetomium sp. MPI-CAGE-AT-0009]
MTMNESDDDGLALPASTLDALKEFYAERDARAAQFNKLKVQADVVHAAIDKDEVKPLSMDAFTEDWNESQFWYSDETAGLYAKLLLDGATSDMTVAVVSTPSVFVALKNALNAAPPEQPKPKLVLLEHDERFNIFPEFVYYDFAQPLKLPNHLKGTCDRIICDPPFLSEDCQTKTALTVRWLARPLTPDTAQQPRLIVCTGERMEDVVMRVYRAFGLRTTDYEPVHARGLANEFFCYANFESSSWGWRKRA